MHSAPAVSYPVGRCHIRPAVLLVPWLLGGAACLVWARQSANSWPLHLAAWSLWLAGSGLAVWGLLRPAQGMLHWDGAQWSWESRNGRQQGAPVVQLDFQHWLLLEFRPLGGQPVWLWPQRAANPLRWHALRRALHSRSMEPRHATTVSEGQREG